MFFFFFLKDSFFKSRTEKNDILLSYLGTL